jgi:hypothetical protein
MGSFKWVNYRRVGVLQDLDRLPLLNGASQVQLTHQLGMAENKRNKLPLVPASEVEDSGGGSIEQDSAYIYYLGPR